MYQINEGQVQTIVYHNESKGETTVRKIIATSVPSDLVRAIDISELNETDQAEVARLYGEYQEYCANHLKRMFSFEDFCTQTAGKSVDPKWRAFKVNSIKNKLA